MKKKIKIVLISGLIVLLAGLGIWFGVKKLRKTTVDVYAVTELSQQVWEEMSNLEGNVSSDMSQEVRLAEKEIVSKVHVQEEQEVKVGDPLLTYDMTLVSIDLEMEKLNKQQLEIKKAGLEHELKKLKKTRAVSFVNSEEYPLQYLAAQLPPELLTTEDGAGQKPGEIEGGAGQEPEGGNEGEGGAGENPGSGEEGGGTGENPGGGEEGGGAGENPGSGEEGGGTGENPGSGEEGGGTGENPGDGNEGDGNQQPEEPSKIEPSGVYKRLYWDLDAGSPDFPDDDAIIEKAVPFDGKGTKEEPLRFLCTKGVLIQGAFLNHIAGFNAAGERLPQYCLLEVRSGDTKDGVLLAAMLLDGSALENPVDAAAWFKTKLGQNEWEIMSPEGEELPNGAGNIISGDAITGGYSKEERAKAIAEKEREIKNTDLDIREADLKIRKKENELQDETVCSIVDGVVKKVGDPAKGEIDGEPFIVVESAKGVYVQGRISEDMLGKLSPGQVLNGMGYESGMPFSAEIRDVSKFPVNDYYMGNQREVSYYGFTAFIENAEGLKNHEMVSMDMPRDDGEVTGLFVNKEYVRNKDGEDFVYKEGKNHKLKKQVIKTGKTYYGFLVEIKEGVSSEDYLAFPYGKKVKDGAKAKRSSLSELYNMY